MRWGKSWMQRKGCHSWEPLKGFKQGAARFHFPVEKFLLAAGGERIARGQM